MQDVRDLSCGDLVVYLRFERRRLECKRCGALRQEALSWLSDNPFYTKRFAIYVGQRCREQSIKSVAEELMLDWKTVKELDKEYMREQLKLAGEANPKCMGVDEISVKQGHEYRIVVSDLEQRRVIWFGGKDRSQESMDEFYKWLGTVKTKEIRLIVMDMWKAFKKSADLFAPQAEVLYDKFHIIRHLGMAMDEVRRREVSRLQGGHRKWVKGQRYHLLSRRENLDLDGRKALKELFRRNKRLNKAYLLKESFGQLWGYTYPGSARKFFENWRDSLKRQRLKPYADFAKMVDKHWEGIVSFCKVENKVSLGFVEGLNNKIRQIQRRAYGLRDEEYLRLKVMTCTLPDLKSLQNSTKLPT
jgi:transposase